MGDLFGRRGFLRGSAALGSVLTCSIPVDRAAWAAAPTRIEVPTVDELVVREITDNQHDIFLRGSDANGLKVARTGFPEAAQGRTLQSQWGLALHVQSRRGAATKRYLLDFGFTPDVYMNNLEILKVDVAQIDALIISHGHYDHVGGLMGFLEAQRGRMRGDLRLYAGGEDDFCHRFNLGPNGQLTELGTPIDRRRLRELGVEAVLSEAPIVIEDQAFTTGVVPRTSFERVLPNTVMTFGVQNGTGCDPAAYSEHHFSADELAGKPVADQHWHEHATCFKLGDRGLVVLTSCGHAGVVNTVRRAQQVSGVDKIHALVGGYHLAPAPDDYLRQVMAELKQLDIEHVFPMHCSGANFVAMAQREMPERLVLCSTGSSYTFTA